MRFGLNGTVSGLQGIETQLGRQLDIRRAYESGDLPATYAQSACGSDWSSMGVDSAYSFAVTGAMLDSIASGAYDNRFIAWWNSIPAPNAQGHPVVHFTFGHEADSKVQKSVFTAAQFQAAMQRCRQVLDAQRAKGNRKCIDQVRLTVCMTAYYWKGSPAFPSLNTALGYGDIVSADPYGKGMYSPTGVQSGFSDWMDANLPNTTKAVWEFSTTSAQPGGKDVWIKDFCAYSFAHGYDYVIGFNSNVGGSEPLLQGVGLDGFRAAMVAYQTGGTPPVVPPPPPPASNIASLLGISLPGQYRVFSSGYKNGTPTPSPTPTPTPSTAYVQRFGVNSSGADFGDARSTTYLGQYDSDASFAFYKTRGHGVIRLPFLWERVQPTLLGALDATELARLDPAVNSITSRGMACVLDVHNYARYKTTDGVNHVLGDGFLNDNHLVDLWTKLANRYKGNPLVQFGLMNEPHDLPGVSGAYTVSTVRYTFDSSTSGWLDEQTTGPATVTQDTALSHSGAASLSVTKAPATATGYWNVRITSQAPIGSIAGGGETVSAWVHCPAGATGWQAYVGIQSGGASTPAYADVKAGAASPLTPGAWTQLTYTLPAGASADVNRYIIQIENNAPGTTSPVTFHIDDITTGSLSGALNGNQQWERTAQAVVSAIRTTGSTNWIWVPAMAYAAVRSWWTLHPKWWINDTANASGPEGHLYFDGDESGTYTQPYATVNSAAVSAGYASLQAKTLAEVKSFTDGCVANGVQGFIGELGWTNQGGADQASWNAVGAATYTALRNAGCTVTAWAAGEAWGSTYLLSVYTGTPQSVLTPIAATVEAGAGTAAPTTPMPTADIPATSSSPGWRFIYGEDFTRGDVPVGSFPGVYANTFDINYADGTKDTAGQSGSPSRYYPSKVLSVTGGVLDMYLHTEAGTPMGAAPAPKLAAGNQWPYNSQTYGRYAVRYRADSLAGFKTAWLLWPDSGVWPGDGEIDYPEGDLGSSSTIGAFAHYASAGGGQDGFDSGKTATTWHIAVTEWAPGSLKFYLDGVLIGTSTTSVPSKPMHYIMQTEACLPTCPLPATAGHLQVDWIAIWAKV